MNSGFFDLQAREGCSILRLRSSDETNRLTRACVLDLTQTVARLATENRALVITGNENYFSVGADLNEIAALGGASAYEFAVAGQQLMQRIDDFPAPTYAAISGSCFGGGLDLALACRHRVASPGAIFGHRGAALGLITGWGGTQRLPRIVGKARALQMFTAAESISARLALKLGLIEEIAADPVAQAVASIQRASNAHAVFAPFRPAGIP